MLKETKKNRNKKRGFTIVEVALSIAIIAIIAGLTVPFYRVFQTQNDLEVTVSTTAQKIRKAQIFSQSGEGDSKWGVSIQEEKLIFFKGESYNDRDQDFDEIYLMPLSITASGLNEVIFDKLTGEPQLTGTITFVSDPDKTRSITVNSMGIINYD